MNDFLSPFPGSLVLPWPASSSGVEKEEDHAENDESGRESPRDSESTERRAPGTGPPPATGRTDLDEILRTYQLIDEGKRVFEGPLGAEAPMTRTEADLLDRLRGVDGNGGLLRFWEVAREAQEAALDAYPPPAELFDREREGELTLASNDGHADAFRHAYWSARLAQEFGTDFAESFVTAHEGSVTNAPDREAMDLYNNGLGFDAVADAPRSTRAELVAELTGRIDAGEALVLDRRGQIDWSDRVAIGEQGHTPAPAGADPRGPNGDFELFAPPPWLAPPEGTRPEPEPVTAADVLFRTDNVDVALPGGLRDYVDPFELTDYALAGADTPRFALTDLGAPGRLGEGAFDGAAFGRVGLLDGTLEIEPVELPFSEPLEHPRVPRLLFGAAAGEEDEPA